MTAAWRMKGEYFKNCNCAAGCPCDFWAPPTHHTCEGMCAMRIAEGNFGSVNLDGMIWAGAYHWPGPLHEGNGTLQPYVLASATPAQREAILTVLSGQAGNPWFEVLASVVKTVLEPKFVPIDFEFDLGKRHARVSIPDELETVTEPIRDLVNGSEHQVRVEMPRGMEYRRCEVAIAKVLRGLGKVRFDCPSGNSSLALVEHTQNGLLA